MNAQPKQFYQPLRNTHLHAILAFCLSILAIILYNFREILAYGDKKSNVEPNSTLKLVQTTTDSFLDLLSSLPFAGTVSTVIFLILIGVSLYIAYVETSNVLIVARNEITLGKSTNNARTKRYFVLRGLAKLLTACIVATTLIISIRFWFPSTFELTKPFVSHELSGQYALDAGLGYILLSLNIYVLFVLLHRGTQFIKKI